VWVPQFPGKPAKGYAVEWRTNLFAGAWQPVLTNFTVASNLYLNFTPPPGSEPLNFYRAKRAGLALAEKVLSLVSADGTNVLLRFSGVAGRTYRVQLAPSLSPPAWQTIGTNTVGFDGLFQFTETNGWGNTQRYYRLISP